MNLTHSNSNLAINEQASQPAGVYTFNDNMLMADTQNNMNVFCDCVLKPVYRTRSVDGLSHNGLVFEATVHGNTVTITIDSKKIFSGFTSVLADLADQGINIPTNRVNDFKRYLQQCSQLKLIDQFIIERTGFIDEYLAYAYGETIIKGEAEIQNNTAFCYRSRQGKSPEGLTVQGTLESYNREVIEQCVTDPLKFAIFMGLASSLAELMGLEGGLFHIFGPSGSGKSTIAQATASVIGSGSEPGDGSKDSYINSWSSTANGLEALLSERSGMGVCLDELGAFKHSKISSALYKLLSGSGTSRMTSNLNKAKQHKASVFGISTGELSIEDKVRQSNEVLNAGLLARMPSLLIEPCHMALEHETLAETAQRIENFKDACTENGGHLAPLFIQGLLDGFDTKTELEEGVRKRWEDCVGLLAEYAQNSIQRRVIRRFALALTAGLLAAELELIPWSEDEITDAIVFMIKRWLVNIEMGKSDLDRAIDRLKDWIRANFHKLPDSTDDKVKSVVDGYRFQGTHITILPDKFRDLCENVTPSQVGNRLKELGVLRYDNGKLQYRVMIPTIRKRQYFYCIDYRFIEDWLENDEDIEDEITPELIDDMLDGDEIVISERIIKHGITQPELDPCDYDENDNAPLLKRKIHNFKSSLPPE